MDYVQKHLRNEYNYVDVQYPGRRTTIVIFRERLFRIENAEQNRAAKEWAIDQGLRREQADWGLSF